MEQNVDSGTPKSSGAAARLWRISRVLLFLATVLGLGSLNILTLVNSQAHAAGVSFLKTILAPALAEDLLSQSLTEKYSTLERSHKALKSEHAELKKVSTSRSQIVKNISTRVARRVAVNAGKNVASYAAEIVPVVGVAAITALTVSDLYDDCQTLKDLNELNLNFEHEISDETTVCGIKFP
ncbi:MAG: hypothetical protein ACR65R_04500 [Methylomicrobium sp.]